MKTILMLVTLSLLLCAAASHAPAPAVSCDKAVTQGAHAGPVPDAAAAGRKGCGPGIRPCSANQVGQPCDPTNPNIICSAQANGAYCCLAYAP